MAEAITQEDIREEMQARLDAALEEESRSFNTRTVDLEAEARRLAEPRFRAGSPQDIAIRGGQPGDWFTFDNDGFASYEPAGNSAREQMTRRLEQSRPKSAFNNKPF